MDYLVSVFVWIMACYGMSTIIVSSVIFEPVRNSVTKIAYLHKLINCMLCTGFWVGVFWGGLFWDPFSKIEAPYALRLLFDGCFGAATTWLIYLKVYPLMYGK